MSSRFQTSFGLWKLLLIIELFHVTAALVNVPSSAYWAENATTVIGQASGTSGSSTYSLSFNRGISITNDDTLYIADNGNNQIVVVQLRGMANVIIIGSGLGTDANNFFNPSDVFVTNTSIYVMDTSNYRVQTWLRNGTNPTTMPGASTFGLSSYVFLDKYMNLYVSDYTNNNVICFAPNSSSPVTVAGNGIAGSTTKNLNDPWGIFVDDVRTVYVADSYNHRIQKWNYNASSGIKVAGTGVSGSSLKQLSFPGALIVDTNGYIYIADTNNNRVVRWAPNAISGVCIAACTGTNGIQANQLNNPYALAFDSNGSMYISDHNNNRVQKFQILNNASQSVTTKQSTLESSFATWYLSPTAGIMSTMPTTQIITSTLVTTSTLRMISTTTIQTTASLSITSSQIFSTSDHVETSPPKILTTPTIIHPSIAWRSIASTSEMSSTAIPSTSFIAPTCLNSTSIGLNCNISNTPCDSLQPCQHHGTCNNTDNDRGYLCSCSTGFNGIECEIDHRPCKLNTCWNNGTCNGTSNTTFKCTCADGWEGTHCEAQTNYCYNITCHNNGVCRPLLLNYTCECLGESYSGRYCEIIATKIIIYKNVSKSVASVAIIAMITVAMFVVIMDILKYCFSIDPTRKKLERRRRKKRPRKHKPVIQRFVYIHAEPISTITKPAV